MYEILIEDLTFETIIGILDFERENLQRVIVNLKFSYKDKKNFIDYAKVAEFIKSSMIEKKYLLLEDAIDDIIKLLKKEYQQIKYIELKISKPDILTECTVCVKKYQEFD